MEKNEEKDLWLDLKKGQVNMFTGGQLDLKKGQINMSTGGEIDEGVKSWISEIEIDSSLIERNY